MRNFILGFIAAAFLFGGISVSARLTGPQITGESGMLPRWDVMHKGEHI